ncbi:hypothetical protein RJ639_016563 [Escallonia herrerae]|uniref:Transcription repressor n=1 Tax=Escallonia herrerae TaxID=1293975 RepID=A0AA89ANZ4_9ASTE|nr:hypothetical protein RJ639_016563 [Escallonia herrerae]
MGKYRFKLADMIPNAWFYKLKDMSKSRNQNSTHPTKKKHQPTSSSSFSSSSSSSSSLLTAPPQPPSLPPKPEQPQLSDQRKSYHFPRDLAATPPPNPSTSHHNSPDPPRKSSKKRRSTRKNRASPRLLTSSVSASCSCHGTMKSVWASAEYSTSSSEQESLLPEFTSFDNMVSLSTSCRCNVHKNFIADSNIEHLDGFDTVSRTDLPPIITKLDQREKSDSSKEQRTSPIRRFSLHSPGLKLRTNSPRIANKKLNQANGRRSVSSVSSLSSRRSLSESCAVVKSSKDPQRDFKESMVEMIMENNIRASKDLEDLLACYLLLNSDEYHELIIKVFKQIWFDITDIKLQ